MGHEDAEIGLMGLTIIEGGAVTNFLEPRMTGNSYQARGLRKVYDAVGEAVSLARRQNDVPVVAFKCEFCGRIPTARETAHPVTACPMVEAVEWHPNGSLKRVELKP